MICLLFIGVLVSVVGSSQQSQPGQLKVTLAGELGRLANPGSLAMLGSDVEAQVSTYDRTGGNNDGFNGTYSFVRRNADSSLVMVDLDGPGEVNRIATPTPTEDTLDFYFDGDERPGLSICYLDLFSGKFIPFLAPLCGSGAGGYYCYYPILFQHHLTIVCRGKKLQFHQIQYRLFPRGTVVEKFSADPDVEALTALTEIGVLWGVPSKMRGWMLDPDGVAKKVKRDTVIRPGERLALGAIATGGRIEGIQIADAVALADSVADIWIRMRWDVEPVAAVECPLADFFGFDRGKPSMAGLLLGVDSGMAYSYLPMAFDSRAVVELEYRGKGEPLRVHSTIQYDTRRRIVGREGELHVSYADRVLDSTRPYQVFANVKGKGSYVGTMLYAQGLEGEGTRFFEGDDSAAVDGVFRIHGTGSEDYFNGGWYDLPGRWDGARSFPLSGCLFYSHKERRSGGYRFYVLDALNFEKGIWVGIEHGGDNRERGRVRYRSLGFYYLVGAAPDLASSRPVLYINQVSFPSAGPKSAILSSGEQVSDPSFSLIDAASGQPVYSGHFSPPQRIDDWTPGANYYTADFSSFQTPGTYRFRANAGNQTLTSGLFSILGAEWGRPLVSAILHYYNKQRANTPEELAADRRLLLYGSDTRVDLHGGWCDASGDVSKYFSHLAYANFMSPQQTPLVTWSLINTGEKLRKQLEQWDLADSLRSEALWGADYIMRTLSPQGYFYMTVFSYFKKDPEARRVVGLHANSVTTDEYQCAFREGGGMAIAALARISQWKVNGDYTAQQYLDAARRAYAHLVVNNPKYDDDGKPNIIDDYCALLAATELWIATDSAYYRDQARGYAGHLADRMTPAGYFRADDGRRPFWHASDAGLPTLALIRYLDKEIDPARRAGTLDIIHRALDYNLRVTGEVDNPFGYARQTFLYRDTVKDGFFIPHENETGWWWQGENARLGSLATVALLGARLFPDQLDSLRLFAAHQLSWILGCNPYSICFLYGFGDHNTPFMHSNYGHGSETGGISNGITGRKDNGDGSGIDFKTSDNGNEWRWTEQWIPHAAWFLQAITAEYQQ